MPENEKEIIEALRKREWDGEPLTEAERRQLDAFYRSLEEQEATYLAPATARLRAKRLARDAQIGQLEIVLEKKRKYLEQLRTIARELEALESEESRLLAAARG